MSADHTDDRRLTSAFIFETRYYFKDNIRKDHGPNGKARVANRKETEMSESIEELKEELTEWEVRLNHDEADMIRFQHRFAAALDGDEVMTSFKFESFLEERKYLADCIEWDRDKIYRLKECIR